MTYSDGSEWNEIDPFMYTKLYQAGYAVGGYLDDNGSKRYVLYRGGEGFRKVHDFATLEELKNMSKLLIDGGM